MSDTQSRIVLIDSDELERELFTAEIPDETLEACNDKREFLKYRTHGTSTYCHYNIPPYC